MATISLRQKKRRKLLFFTFRQQSKGNAGSYGFTEKMAEPDNAFIVYTGLKMEKKYRENRTSGKQQTIPTVKNAEEQY